MSTAINSDTSFTLFVLQELPYLAGAVGTVGQLDELQPDLVFAPVGVPSPNGIPRHVPDLL